MRRLPRTDVLIKAAREKSVNADYGDNYGISDSFFLTSIRQAAVEIQSYLVGQMIELNAQFEEYSAVPGQEPYALPERLFSDNLVYNIDYSRTGLARDYAPLSKMGFREYMGVGEPEQFFIDGDNFYVDYSPSSTASKFRVRYEQRLDRADIPRAKVVSWSAPNLVLSTDGLDSDAFGGIVEYVCVCDRYGNTKARNIPVESYNSGSSTVVAVAGYALSSGEAIAAGDVVTIGEDTTTHIPLFPICENYIIEYAKNEAYESQSSEDQNVSNPKLEKLLQRIASVYEYNSGGKSYPIERRNG